MISSQEKSATLGSHDTANREFDIFAKPTINENGEEIYVAGQLVRAGMYRQVDSFRIITLEKNTTLPPSFDGHRAEYCRFEQPWARTATGFQAKISQN